MNEVICSIVDSFDIRLFAMFVIAIGIVLYIKYRFDLHNYKLECEEYRRLREAYYDAEEPFIQKIKYK